MTIIRNDIGPISLAQVLRFLIIAFVIFAAGFLLWKQMRKQFFPAPVDADKCKDDPNYEFKDPDKHPDDCY